MANVLVRQRLSVGIESNRLCSHSRTDNNLEDAINSGRKVRHIADWDKRANSNGEQKQVGQPPLQNTAADAIPPDAHLSPQHIAVSFQAQSAIPTIHP